MSEWTSLAVGDPLRRVEQIRDAMPAVLNTVYLNTGTCGPLPRRTITAMQQVQQQELLRGRTAPYHYQHIMEVMQDVKAVAAEILHCDAHELALSRHTTDGMNLALAGYSWQPGQEIILSNLEHPSGLLPTFLARRRFGVHVRIADVGLGNGTTEDIVGAFERQITQQTRMIVLSHVPYTTGTVLPLKEIVAMAHRHGVLVTADGAQSFGHIPLDLHDLEVDFYACPGQKWMCGPEGTGLFYARSESLEMLEQTIVGPFGMRQQTLDYLGAWYDAAEGARRFDVGSASLALLTGQKTSMAWLKDEIGMNWITDRITALGAYASQRLNAIEGVQVVTPPERMAGLVAFIVPDVDPPELTQRLFAEHNVTIRHVDTYINNPRASRLSAGFYNTTDDIERLADAITAIRSTSKV